MYDDNNRGMNSFWTLATGFIIGGATVMLADEKTRGTLKRKISELMGQVENLKETGKEKVQTELKKARRKLDQIAPDNDGM